MSLPLNPIPTDLLFKGRPGDPRLGEWVECVSEVPEDDDGRPLVALYGCPDDTGVTINRGRPGAKDGPNSIRTFLYKMALPMDLEIEKKIRLIDLGNIKVESKITDTHANAEKIAQLISSRGGTLIALGGGHDFAAPNVIGWAKGQSNSLKGLLNVDPHLDFRPLENKEPHSGSPFRQILESKLVAGKHFVEFGARSNRNARDHFNACKKTGTKILSLDQIRGSALSSQKLFQRELSLLSKKVKHLALTIDMDSCSEGEGTSAAPVIGFSAQELYAFVGFAGTLKNLSYFEVAEVAPGLDPKLRTPRIGAELVFSFLYSFAATRKTALNKALRKS